jgi:predicted amidohydrolase YtcJ
MAMKKEFTVEREGKTFVLYAGLLDLAHERGLKAITTTLVQIPNELNGNVAICHATVETEQGTFTGLGDAAPTNVNRMMSPHLIRMAETRAKARALRDAVNVGVTALEELADVEDLDPDERSLAAASRQPAPKRSLRPVEQAPALEFGFDPDDQGPRSGRSAASHSAQNGTAVVERAPVRAATPGAGGPAATPKQLETIARMARAAGKSVETDGLTRAQASEIISNLIGEMGERRAS